MVTQQTTSPLFIISHKVSTTSSPAFFITKKPESIAEVITIGNYIRTVAKLPRNGMKWAIGQRSTLRLVNLVDLARGFFSKNKEGKKREGPYLSRHRLFK